MILICYEKAHFLEAGHFEIINLPKNTTGFSNIKSFAKMIEVMTRPKTFREFRGNLTKFS